MHHAASAALRPFVAAAFVAALCASASAQEHVIFQVLGRDKVQGTIRPAYEAESFRCDVVLGTTIRATVKATGKNGPVPRLVLRQGGFDVPGSSSTTKGRTTSLVPFVVPATGRYDVVVEGDDLKDGDYMLKVQFSPQTSFTGTGTAPAQTTFPFSAPANSRVTVALVPQAGSAFLADLVALHGPLGENLPLSGGGRGGPVTLPSGGDWTVEFANDGGDGAWDIAVKVAAPKPPKSNADLRDGALSGAFSGGPVVVGALATPGEGVDLQVEGTGTPLDGSAVDVPPDALGSPTIITVSEGDVFYVDDGVHAAGPAVQLGPSGTTFDPEKPAKVTIPFDPAAFPSYPPDLTVWIQEDDGTLTAAPQPYTIDGNTVSFFVSGFSTVMATSTAPRPVPDGYFDVVGVYGGPAGNVPAGHAGVASGSVLFTDGVVISYAGVDSVTFDNAGVTEVFSSLDLNGPTTLLGDNAISVGGLSFSGYTLTRGYHDDVLFASPRSGVDFGLLAFVRRPQGSPTLNTLAGKWNFVEWVFGGTPGTAGGPSASAATAYGTATIRADGTATFATLGGTSATKADLSTQDLWTSAPVGTSSTPAIVSVDVEGGTSIRFSDNPFADVRSFQIITAAGGDMLFVTLYGADVTGRKDAIEVGLLVLVRGSSNAHAAALAGAFFEAGGGVAIDVEGTAEPDPLGLEWRGEFGSEELVDDRTLFRYVSEYRSGYDSQGVVFSTLLPSKITEVPIDVVPTPPTWSLSRSGAYKVPALDFAGGATPDGQLLAFVRRDGPFLTLHLASKYTTSPSMPSAGK